MTWIRVGDDFDLVMLQTQSMSLQEPYSGQASLACQCRSAHHMVFRSVDDGLVGRNSVRRDSVVLLHQRYAVNRDWATDGRHHCIDHEACTEGLGLGRIPAGLSFGLDMNTEVAMDWGDRRVVHLYLRSEPESFVAG